MNIPGWIDTNKRKKSERASARLRYMLALMAAKHTGRQSMRALGEKVGLDHSTLSTYIRRGSFSLPAATRIVDTLKDPALTVDHLLSPLEIPKSPG